MKKTDVILISLSVIFILIGLILIVFLNDISQILYEFVRLNISSDHHIQGGEASFRMNIYFAIICSFGVSFLLFSLTLKIVKSILRDFFQNKEVTGYFFSDAYTSTMFSKIILFTAIVLNLFIVQIFKFSNNPFFVGLFGEDNFFEWATAIFFLVSSITLMIGSFKLFNNKSYKFEFKNILILGFVLFSLLNFWIFGEEISWGQRLFNWQSSENFDMNFQNETNIHNFFNPIINPTYSLVTFSFAVILLIGWIRNRKNASIFYQIGFPHASLFSSAIVIIYASGGYLEMAELILSLFILLYSLRIFLVSNNIQKKRIVNS